MNEIKEVIGAINRCRRFLITAHINLEGDSIGSQLAIRELLNAMGKTAFIIDSDPVPAHYKFLPKANEISNKIDKKMDYDAAVVVDCPTLKRTGKVAELISKNKNKVVINIDHHVSNERFGDVNWVDPNASSAGELVFKLFKETGKRLTKETALNLYIAILTDTGSFNYDNTSSLTHEIAGELLGYGLEPAAVSESVYERRSIGDIKLLGLVLSTIKLNNRGDVAYLELTNDVLKKTGADAAKSEGFVNYARSIDKVKVAVLFREEPKEGGRIHVSLRSKGSVDVNRIASSFGGGGHARASGCVVEGTLVEVEKSVLSKIEERLRGRHTGR
ncbi:MAG: bifunctional oligoribonuclease/PAP phosphatase NrnA [Candidatus Omnitrophica bacterium]|nr:bifunctional oligoribonuclease/PAP phosphatase NrnA [Candidatus Omnitrophota bacterium]